MKYRICTVESCNSEYIIDSYPCLKKYNFEVAESKQEATTRIRDERGQFISQVFYRTIRTPYVTIENLEQLAELIKDVNNPIIISGCEGDMEIEIYDGYRE